MALFWLSDEAWTVIEPHLPRNQPGARRVDDRRVISGILHVLKVGCRWCDCPADYGPSTTVYNRFNRWSRRGFWLIENAFCRMKDFRRVATRYDKLAANFLSGVALATAFAFWL